MIKYKKLSRNRHFKFAQAIIGGFLIIYGANGSISNPILIIFLFLGLIPFTNSVLDTL